MTKPTKWHVRPAKTQISLGIRPVWSESSLCTQWVPKDPSLGLSSCGQRRLWSDWAAAQADLSLRWAHKPFYWFCHEAAHFYNYINDPKFSDRQVMANRQAIAKRGSVDLEQTAPRGTVWCLLSRLHYWTHFSMEKTRDCFLFVFQFLRWLHQIFQVSDFLGFLQYCFLKQKILVKNSTG